MKITIEWTYHHKGVETVFRSEEMPPAHALSVAEELMKTGRTKNILFLDEHDSTWTLKEIKKYIKEMETEPSNVTVYFDGGFNLESRISGLGCVIYFEQNGKKYRLRKNLTLNGLSSNNEAEYAALHFSVQELESLGVHHQTVRFIGDSQVVINQMSGEWPVYEKELMNWADRIDESLNRLGIKPEFEPVSRKENEEADRLANQALDDIEIDGKIELQ
ncbi:reverse transcriptase-like protein [Ureibacillus suwonensis]|uniref:Reverse transcriptase-like protein n=1 Tax=Ureibacillus suwonensis TaxID=313007 RepID=A0ABW0R8E4_9BACL